MKFYNYLKKSITLIIYAYRSQGMEGIANAIKIWYNRRLRSKSYSKNYQRWIKKYSPTKQDLLLFKNTILEFKLQPTISIIVPIYNVDSIWLDKCVNSVINQIYEKWELILIDDKSTKSYIREKLDYYASLSPKIKILFNETNLHISLTSNKGLDLATGEYVGFLDNDDELAPEALFEFVKVINNNPNLKFIYSDEDYLNENGDRINPVFKPDWCKYMTMSQMYTTHFSLYKTDLAKSIGGYRKGFEGSQDYDFVLRITEMIKETEIYHIPKVLYHWRIIPGSTAIDYNSKSYARTSATKALNDAIIRRNLQAELVDGNSPWNFRIKYKILNNPKVSIIIPTKNGIDLVKKCIESIRSKTTYSNYEIILVDNSSDDPASLKYFEELNASKIVNLINYPGIFNYAAINNFAVGHTSGEFLLFLNNDTEIITDDWIESMLEFAQLDDVGCVGAKLIYPNDKIQHAGVVIGLGGYAAHSHRGADRNDKGYLSSIEIIREYSAVTAACLMISKSKFIEVQKFDEINFPVAYNDVDLCLKCLDKGYKNIYTPFAELYHYESISRGEEDTPEKLLRFSKEKENFRLKWQKYIDLDPYYSINLTRNFEDFSLKE